MEVGGQLHASATLPAVKNIGTHWIGGWVGPRAGLDGLEKRKCVSWQFTLAIDLGSWFLHSKSLGEYDVTTVFKNSYFT
jgi:hypothetical protein